MSVKLADTVSKYTHILSAYSKLVVLFYHQSTAPSDKLSLFGELARRIPSYQFACVDLDRVKAIESLSYFGDDHGIVVFVDGALQVRFAGEKNEFYQAMDDMDKDGLDKLAGIHLHCGDELALGKMLADIVNRHVDRACKRDAQEKQKSVKVNISVTVDA